MGLNLPLYFIVGEKPVSFEKTESGGALLLGWDFKKKKMTHAAASWNDVVGLSTGVPVEGSGSFSESGTEQVTKKQFNAAVRKLQNA